MRLYKPTYSKPLPDGMKIFTRKGIKYARFKDNKGTLQEARLTKSGDGILCESKKWYIRFEDNIGIRRSVKGYTDKQATQRLADNVQKLLNYKANNQPLDKEMNEFIKGLSSAIRTELIKINLLDGQMSDWSKTLTEHIKDFEDYLTKKERNPIHIREITGTLRRIFRECGFVTWTDIRPEPLMNFLDGLRDEGRGISKRRYNGLLGAAKHFCKWMVKQRKAAGSPIDYLDGLDNPQTDQRHSRRVLELDEFRRFLDTALAGPKIYGMTGHERNFVYRFTTETGLRSIDLHRLRVQDCNFEERKIVIEAGRTKNKQRSFVYLKPATTLELQQYCKNKLPHTKVFHLTDKTSKMVRLDLAAADIPYVDSNGEYFDFHSLRHQSASLFGMNPDTPEAVRQQLTRHKNPEMARHYTHASEQQQREAVEALPDLTQPSKETQAQVKTGTDNDFLLNSCFEDGHQQTPADTSGMKRVNSVEKTPLCVYNDGPERIPKPKVRGSSPLGRSFVKYRISNDFGKKRGNKKKK
ncbi:MAG TPA: tyrosine-type recombinase/integrase [Sedimentisphaerales bacterium]|nr:tyrosine-type recombinase/integrase [Sedimentisphaerales bacterium]